MHETCTNNQLNQANDFDKGHNYSMKMRLISLNKNTVVLTAGVNSREPVQKINQQNLSRKLTACFVGSHGQSTGTLET